MVSSGIRIFLKRKKKISLSMNGNATKDPSEDQKQRTVEYKKNII